MTLKPLPVQSVVMKFQNKPTTISLFSGCGGSSCGYHLAGYNVLLAVEMDNHAVQTYKKNFPNTKVFHGDIHNLTTEKVLDLTGLKVGELDLLDGSPPCQSFSMAGKREYCDSKNQLYHEYIRLLRGLKPKTFVMENVKGLVSGNMKIIFKDILKELKNSGYDVKVKLMNAMYYNCATSRQRLIFIGVRNDLKIPASHPKPQTKPITIKQCLNGYRDPIRTPPTFTFLKENTHKVKPGERFSKYHPKGNWFGAVKLDVNKPLPTIVKQCYGMYIFPDNTIMQPSEAALCQSFPKNFKWIGGLNQQWQRIGNSVPPNLMKAIALHIKENILEKIEK